MRVLPAHPPVPDIAELREAVRRAYGPDEEMTSSVTELVLNSYSLQPTSVSVQKENHICLFDMETLLSDSPL